MLRVVKIGETAVNLDAIASAHWERDTLFVHLIGGRFLSLARASAGERIWSAFVDGAVDLASSSSSSSSSTRLQT